MAIKEKIHFAKEWVLDLFFPKFCLICGREGTWCCENCLNKIGIEQSNICPFCAQPAAMGRISPPCQKVNYLSQLINLGFYHEKDWQDLIQSFKYQYIEGCADIIRELLKRFLKKYPEFKNSDYQSLVPIPLHSRRFLERNFNQAEVLAEILSRELGLGVESSVLKRIKNTQPQAQLKDEERKKNIIGVFEVVDESKVMGKKILLVDDVFTTGSTLKEAAKTLLAAGAREVGAWVMVRRT
jgi:competence protein ComFC